MRSERQGGNFVMGEHELVSVLTLFFVTVLFIKTVIEFFYDW